MLACFSSHNRISEVEAFQGRVASTHRTTYQNRQDPPQAQGMSFEAVRFSDQKSVFLLPQGFTCSIIFDS